MSEQKPREALDCFNQALLKIGTRADRPEKAWVPLCAAAFDAKTYGAHAAILCAEATPDADFISERIPKMIERLNEALSVSPENEYIMHLLSRAQELMTKENLP
jgi:hypothetical protein